MIRFVVTPPLYVGAFIVSTLGPLTYVLVALVIALDMWLGRRFRSALIFAVVQFLGLAAGWVWAFYAGARQSVAGPLAAALVVGVWIICVVVFHIWLGARVWRGRAVFKKGSANRQ